MRDAWHFLRHLQFRENLTLELYATTFSNQKSQRAVTVWHQSVSVLMQVSIHRLVP